MWSGTFDKNGQIVFDAYFSFNPFIDANNEVNLPVPLVKSLKLDQGFEDSGFILNRDFNFEPIDHQYGGEYEFVTAVTVDIPGVCDIPPDIVGFSSVPFTYFPMTSP
jgi:hypothetical protein